MANDLFIKYTEPDAGNPITPCTDYWTSPSLWLSDPPGESGNVVDAGTARVGRRCMINVRVSSKSGTPKAPTRVQLWVCNFTIAVGPAGSVRSLNPANPPAGKIITVNPGPSSAAPGVGAVAWTPTADDLINAPGGAGHLCLAGNAFFASPDSELADGAQITDPTTRLDICGNRHHGQRNIAVQAVNAGGDEMKFRMQAGNPGGKNEKFQFEVAELRPKVLDPTELSHLASTQFAGVLGDIPTGPGHGKSKLPGHLGTGKLKIPHLGTGKLKIPHLGTGKLRIPRSLLRDLQLAQIGQDAPAFPQITDFGDTPEEAFERTLKGTVPILLRAGDRVLLGDRHSAVHPATSGAESFDIASDDGQAGTDLTLALPPGEEQTVTFSATVGAQKPGAVSIFDVTQKAPDGQVLGGARILALAT